MYFACFRYSLLDGANEIKHDYSNVFCFRPQIRLIIQAYAYILPQYSFNEL